MKIYQVNENNIELFSDVLINAAKWLDSTEQPMWKVQDLSAEELLKKYDMNDMKLCYDNGNLIGVFILQWCDCLFWPELNKNSSGFVHKLAVTIENRKQGNGKKILESAEDYCKDRGIYSLRLNCGTARLRLRNFYESAGFQMLDRVFIDNRDQIRYEKTLM